MTRVADMTPFGDINDLLLQLKEGLMDILGSQLAGLYLTGSLTYGDFDRGSSDIDFLAVLRHELTGGQRGDVEVLHKQIAYDHPGWAERVDGSYITCSMLNSTDSPQDPRPYINGGKFWQPDPRFGHEWLLNLFVLRACGRALTGPDMKELLQPIDIELIRDASRRDFEKEWVPVAESDVPIDDHHQAYITLTLCRILHRARNDSVVSKRGAAAWVKTNYDARWRNLIERAEGWQHGQEMHSMDEVRAFVNFVGQALRN